MQEGKAELEQLPDFLRLWIDYLGACGGKDAERLLAEAVALQNDSGQALEAARKFSGQHPGLYEQILRQNLMSGKDEEQFRMEDDESYAGDRRAVDHGEAGQVDWDTCGRYYARKPS